jgi:hypothetical protein
MAATTYPADSRPVSRGPHAGAVAIYPGDTTSVMTNYFSTAAARVQLGAFLQCGSAIALGIVTAAATNRMRLLGACGIGIRIAFLGGMLAASLSLLEAGVVWILAQTGVAGVSGSAAVVRALYLFAFMLDGPAYAGSLGLLLAGLAAAGLMGKLLPRWLAWAGLVIAGLGELSFLSMLVPVLGMLIPMTRFPGYLWLITAGFFLSARKSTTLRG